MNTRTVITPFSPYPPLPAAQRSAHQSHRRSGAGFRFLSPGYQRRFPITLSAALLRVFLAFLLLWVHPSVFAASIDLFMVIHADRVNYSLQQTISAEQGSVVLSLPARSGLTDVIFIDAEHETLNKQYETNPEQLLLDSGSVIIRHSGKLEALLVPREDGTMEFMLQPVMVDTEFSGESQIRQSASVMLPAGLEFVSRQNQPYESVEAKHRRNLRVVTSGKRPLRVPIRFRVVDSDADGVADPDDHCTASAESALVDAHGCEPDADADGVSDLLDMCPHSSYAAKVNAQGCEPDADNDGLVDRFDQCNDTQTGTPVNEHGCDLDSDQDTVVDTLDQCPDSEPGEPVNSQGCSLDFDRDGVANFRDLCSGTDSGRSVDANGCEQDNDRDGIIDRLDVCLQTPRDTEVDETGCSLDSDNDGIPDYRDLCTGTSKSADSFGCAEAKEKTGIVLQDVIFSGTGAALDNNTRQALDRVARAVNFHQPVSFEIGAHTAEFKDSKQNLEISAARAESARQYLMVRGVPPNQVIAKGYGDKKPLDKAPETAKPGRKQGIELRMLLK